MAEGRQRAEWEQTATLAWLLAEPNRDEKEQATPYTPDHFNPFAERAEEDEEQPLTVIDLRKAFLGW